MHDTVVVVSNSKRINIRFILLIKIGLCSSFNVASLDVHIVVSIWSGVLVFKTDGMTNFMHDDIERDTSRSKRDALSAKES